MNRVATFLNMNSFPHAGDSTPTPRSATRRVARLGAFGAACATALLLTVAPAGAQTYSNGSDGSTGQGSDGGTTTTTTMPGGGDTGTGSTGGTGDTGGDGGVVGQADDGGDLAFTGSDTISLALIGAGIATAGGLLVVGSRRRVDEQPA